MSGEKTEGSEMSKASELPPKSTVRSFLETKTRFHEGGQEDTLLMTYGHFLEPLLKEGVDLDRPLNADERIYLKEVAAEAVTDPTKPGRACDVHAKPLLILAAHLNSR